MKKTELRKIIKEEIQKTMVENIDPLKTILKDDTLKPIGVINVEIENYLSKNSQLYLSRKDDKVYIVDDRGNIFASNDMGGSLTHYGHISK